MGKKNSELLKLLIIVKGTFQVLELSQDTGVSKQQMEMPRQKVNIATYLRKLHGISVFQLSGSVCFFFPSEDDFFLF